MFCISQCIGFHSHACVVAVLDTLKNRRITLMNKWAHQFMEGPVEAHSMDGYGLNVEGRITWSYNGS